jgi:hypothetical protein
MRNGPEAAKIRTQNTQIADDEHSIEAVEAELQILSM